MTIPPEMVDFIYIPNGACTTYVQQANTMALSPDGSGSESALKAGDTYPMSPARSE